MSTKIIKTNIGSEWRKWDLHIHSLYTNLENQYGVSTVDDFIKKIKEGDIDVVGLTNYFNFSEKDFTLKESLEKEGIAVFLNLELRLTYQNKEDDCCDIHVVFDNELEKAKILQFLSNLTVHVDTTDKKANQLTNGDYKKGVVEFDKLRETLNEKSLGMEGRYYIGFLSRGKGNARSSTVYSKIAENSNFLIHSSSNENNLDDDQNYWMSQDKPLVQSSDSHNIISIGNKFTWIKTAPTFEGLKQIAYEPKYRISYKEPKLQVNYISEIKLKIPDDAKVGEDKFCFAGSDKTYNLSPYFNCFIGGRGSGKSTILNFLGLHSNNPNSPKKFWDGLSPSFDPNQNGIFSFGGTEIFEFLAQSEIETFARDKSKFTQAIYDRANSYAGNILEEYEEAIESLKGKLSQIIQAVSDLKTLEDQKIGKEKEKRTLESSVKVLSSKEYNEVITGITGKSKELQKLEDWKKNISDLKNSLSELIPESESEESKEEVEKTEYEKAYNLAIAKIAEAVELLKEEKFADEAKKETEINKALTELEAKAKTLIEKAGYTPESVEQIKSAPQKITNLESEIKSLTAQIEAKTKVITTFESVVTGLNTNRQNYETKITEILKPLQDLLKKQYEDNQGKDIKQISLKYSFNEKGAWVALAEEFYNHFFSKYHDTERSKEVCEFITGNEQTFSKNSFDDVRKIIQQSQKNEKKYTKFLDEVFKEEKNFQIFQAIRDKHLYDVKLNKIIQVKYDNRDVEQASFGQRCTAVVVILLLFGNYPLIIDEPEAHLDSSLIANYLVPLLKEKKSDRQIIFATHNANFVINGDAEKIFILKNESGQTEVIETTIEDTKNREELLKLEGGKEAFEKRGEKLNIK
ncbi:MAG: AAA family ATPase [Candidatus Gracilibacteria bacterium]